MGKFKVGDVLIDSYGYRYKVIEVRKDRPRYPYVVQGITYGGVCSIGEYGEWWGTGSGININNVVLDVDYVVSKMWEEYENTI
jgi:hypothetical protein